MTTRDEFEKWAKEKADLGDYLKRRSLPSGEQFYIDEAVHHAYLAWQSRQQEIDALKARVASFDQWPNVDALRQCMIDTAEENAALKAEIQRLKSKDHIRDTTKMILPPEISRQLLGKIVDEVFSGAIEDVEVIEDIYRMIAKNQSEHKLNMVASGNQDALDAARYRFLKANLVGGFDLPGLYSLDVIDHESWDATIDESMKHATGESHE